MFEKPCYLCNGQQRSPCMICGWKRGPKKKKIETKESQYEIERKKRKGLRDEFLLEILQSLLKHSMPTTGSKKIDDKIIKTDGDWKAHKQYLSQLKQMFDILKETGEKSCGDSGVDDRIKAEYGSWLS